MSVSSWNAFDWVLATIVLFSMVRAFMSGLVLAVAGLLGFFVGFEAASWGYIDLADRFIVRGWIPSREMARTVAFLVIVVLVVVAFEFFGRIARKSLRTIGMGTFDRLLGAGFGFIRGCLAGMILLMAASAFVPHSEIVTKSVLRPYLFTVLHDVSFLIPDYVQQRIL